MNNNYTTPSDFVIDNIDNITINNNDDIIDNITTDNNIAVVFNKLPKKYLGRRVVTGDKSDLRFLDPKKTIIGLLAKGRAKKDNSGFTVIN